MRVGAALRYCSHGCLFARGLTNSYLTWTVIHTLAAPPNSISWLWRSWAQSPCLQKAPDRGQALHWEEAGTWSGGNDWLEHRWAGRVASIDLESVEGVQWEFQPYRIIGWAAVRVDVVRVNVVEVNVMQVDEVQIDVMQVVVLKIVLLLLRWVGDQD